MIFSKSCAVWSEKLAARHFEDLSAQEHAALDAHVATCAACAIVQARYTHLSERIHVALAGESLAPPRIFVQSLYQPICEEAPRLRAARKVAYRREEPVRGGSVFGLFVNAALLLAITLISFTVFHQLPSSSVVSSGPQEVTAPQLLPNAYVIVGKPTISMQQINAILEYNHSPAAGKGQALYDLGLKYGIDPVFALAFFKQESYFGLVGESGKRLSLGNLRCISGVECQNNYAWFPSWEAGFEVWYKLMRNLYVNQWHLKTVEQILPRYSPAENNLLISYYIKDMENFIDSCHAGKVAF